MNMSPKNPDPRYIYAQPKKPTMRQVAVRQMLGNIAAWTLVGLVGVGSIIGIFYLIGLIF